jgi:histidine ammonia-lyase
MPRDLHLTGQDLTRRDFYQVVLENRRVKLSPRARQAMTQSRQLVEKIMQGKEAVYGVTTGVGSLSTERIDPAQARELQLNVVRIHACGVGEPLDARETRGLLLLRANTLAVGLSGVRPLVAELLCGFLNNGVHPVVPARGSVGASGDLAPLAHVALALVGEGNVLCQGRRQPWVQGHLHGGCGEGPGRQVFQPYLRGRRERRPQGDPEELQVD